MNTLSNLSTDEHIVRNLSLGTPHTSKIPSKILLWLIYWEINYWNLEAH